LLKLKFTHVLTRLEYGYYLAGTFSPILKRNER
jgi:hypothetical protein